MYQTLLFYKYARLDDAEQYAERHLEFCKSLGIKGRILVATEGLNGTVSGTPEQCARYMQEVESDERLQGIHWKVDEVPEPSFVKLFVRFRPEIVHSGLRELGIDPTVRTGVHLSPEEFMEMKDRDDVVVLDVRSNYEHRLGRFDNALTLDIENFREFPDKVRELEHLKDKKILTYCTGGIKCEKASAFLLSKGFEQVYQLHGGIINYGKTVGGKDFEGDCYVFDGRVHVPVNRVNPKVITACLHCGAPTTRMVNCANPHCNDHFVQCSSCGEALQGCCSRACRSAPLRRPYNEKGYYPKTGNG